MGFEPTHALTRLTVFKTVPFSQTWVILREHYIAYHSKKNLSMLKKRSLKSKRSSKYDKDRLRAIKKANTLKKSTQRVRVVIFDEGEGEVKVRLSLLPYL